MTEDEILERMDASEAKIRLEKLNPFTANENVIKLEELSIDACKEMLKVLRNKNETNKNKA